MDYILKGVGKTSGEPDRICAKANRTQQAQRLVRVRSGFLEVLLPELVIEAVGRAADVFRAVQVDVEIWRLLEFVQCPLVLSA